MYNAMQKLKDNGELTSKERGQIVEILETFAFSSYTPTDAEGITFQKDESKTITNNITGKRCGYIVEGDNLDAAARMLEDGVEVDLIYLDPPYNTNRTLAYNDRRGADGSWNSFMYPRLKLSHSLLKEDGFICISIDDNEIINLRLMLDEIFGAENLISVVAIQNSVGAVGVKAEHVKRQLAKVKEYLVIYAKDKAKMRDLTPLYTKRRDLYDPHYRTFLNKDLTMQSFSDMLKEDEVIIKAFGDDNITLKNLDKVFQRNEDVYRYFIEKYADNLYADGSYNLQISEDVDRRLRDGEVVEVRGRYVYRTKKGAGKPRILIRMADGIKQTDDLVSERVSAVPIGDIWDYSGDYANSRLEGGISFPNGKKPLRLLKNIIKLTSVPKDGVILDLFAGSGTAGHATIEANKQDGGVRQFILCNNDENNICEEITYQRIANVAQDKNTRDYIDKLECYKVDTLLRQKRNELDYK